MLMLKLLLISISIFLLTVLMVAVGTAGHTTGSCTGSCPFPASQCSADQATTHSTQGAVMLPEGSGTAAHSDQKRDQEKDSNYCFQMFYSLLG